MAISYNFVDPGEIQDASRKRLTSIFDDSTRYAAGKAQAAGDYEAASRTLAGGGLAEEAQKTRAYGQGLADDAASREGLTDYVAGDYSKARGAFARAGSLPGVQAADAGAKASRAQTLELTLKLANALEKDVVDGGADPAGAFDRVAPIFERMFPESAKELPAYRDMFLKDPRGTIDAIRKATQEEYTGVLKRGESAFINGRVAASVAPEQEYLILPPGGKAIPKPGTGPGPTVENGVATASAPLSPPTGGVYDQVASIAGSLGAAPDETDYLRQLARVESAGNPSARNGSSTGIFQFQPATFQRVGGGNINDVGDQTKAALQLAREDRAKLQELGLPTDPATLYLMHQQGAGGGPALLTAPPEINAIAALTPAYGGNEARARQAVLGNGGTADMTAGEFVQSVRNYFTTGQRSSPGPAAAGGGDPPGVLYGQPKPGYRMATSEEKRANGLPDDQPYQVSPDGQFSKLDSGKKGTSVKLPPGSNLTDLGDGWFRDPIGRLYQPDNSGKLIQTAGVTDAAVDKAITTVSGLNEILTAIDAFDQATKALSPKEIGPTGRYVGDQSKYATARAAATNLMMLLKGPAAYNLGVITGPDLQLLEGVVENPDRLGLLVRQGQILPKLQVLSRGLGSKYGATAAGFKAAGGDPAGLPPIYKSPKGKYGQGAKGATPKAVTNMTDAQLKAALGL